MRQHVFTLTLAALVSASVGLGLAAHDSADQNRAVSNQHGREGHSVQLGPARSFWSTTWTTAGSSESSCSCSDGPFKKTDFSIGHRGAALQFPEHTRESYEAGARMGAGILECDVTFTKDKELVCRHAQNDLHTTTNILVTPLASSASSRSRRPCSDPTARSSRRRRPSAAPATSRWPSSRP